MARESYDHLKIEPAMQAKWEALDLHTTDLTDTEKDPAYLLVEFPYPSGDLHTGHWYAYAMPDIYARYLRMKGKNVLFPIGFDAFGLPAENAAIKRGLDPKEWTYANMDTMRTQLKRMGTSFDWSKEVITSEPEYYKWTQWLFAKLYEHKLAERREAAVKWCPVDLTVLANEQVSNGHCERCGAEVEEKILTQWFLKITQYAKRLLTDLDPLPWREEIKDAQRAWIGESEGAKISFPLESLPNNDLGVSLEVFTTRPDTIFGVTYVVLAPEHPLVATLLATALNAPEVEAYRTATERKTERERSENKEKTGVQIEGVHALNPANGEPVPVYVADYVLASYGTGAVMAVPAHDERDFEFAQKYELPIKQVILPQVTDLDNPPQAGKEDTERDIIVAIVHDPKKDKYLCLKWKKQNWTTFITGGIENDEDAVVAATREIREETGYTDFTLTRVLGGVFESRFYAAHKGVNRKVRSQAILFTLNSDAREEVTQEEKDAYDVAWLSKEEVIKAKLQHGEFDLIWQRVLTGMDVYTGPGVLLNSAAFDGMKNEEVFSDIVTGIGGELVTQYRLRDWLVSRQRYWGCPIPVVYDPEGNPHLIPAEHLPWQLPTDVDFSPTGKSPLATSKELHERVENIFGPGWRPEYDTLDTFVDSSWYYLRYLDTHDSHDFSDQKMLKKWMPVQRYSGGSEHTTMHLLYARFFNKALHDLDLVPTSEPFGERFNRGIILGTDGQKMSKSKGNVLNPDELVKEFGADSVRAYLAFIGPYNEPGSYPWKLDGVEAIRRFLDRIYRLSARVIDADISPELSKSLSKATTKIAQDAERFKFNTALSALMILVRDLESPLCEKGIPRTAYEQLLILTAPFAPHIADHLWETIGNEGSVHQQAWPEVLAEAEEELATVIVQINSKKKGEISIAKDASEEDALAAAKELSAVAKALSEGFMQRAVYVPGRILNLVI